MSTSTNELPVGEVSMEVVAEEAVDDTRPIPAGFVPHTESTTTILFAAPKTTNGAPVVFLNPVQEYNRDLSIVAIRTWSEIRQKEKAKLWETGIRKKWDREARKLTEGDSGAGDRGKGKRRKVEDGSAVVVDEGENLVKKGEVAAEVSAVAEPILSEADKSKIVLSPPTFKFTLLEALSASGLRAIRYAKEIPLLRYVVANDLSATAVVDIKRNIAWNNLSPPVASTSTLAPEESTEFTSNRKLDRQALEDAALGKVRVNEGDACTFMYNHRTEATRFDCIDLDPYGSAVPFLDAAIGAVADGGLLCITCTDLGVLAGHNYPEKAFSAYGGACVNAEFSHEVALRLVLHSIAATAARYGRHIEPLLSLSIDFYVRLFIRVHTGPKEVKGLAAKTALLYYCHDCQTPHFQPFGRQHHKAGKTGVMNTTYHAPSGPPPGVTDKCGECGGKRQIGGPLWYGPLHDPAFVEQMLVHVDEHRENIATGTRMHGMLNVAKAELETPLYFTASRLCSFFNAMSPAMSTFASGILNAGYKISPSHASPGSIKTDAPREFVLDVVREWIKVSPVKMENVKDTSLAFRLIAKPQTHSVDLTYNPGFEAAMLNTSKVVKFQQNPVANWGPLRMAVIAKAAKQSKEVENEEIVEKLEA